MLPPSQVTLSIYSQFIQTCIYVVLCKKLIFTFGPQDQIRCGRVSSKDMLLHVVEINTIFYTLSNIAIGLLRKSSAGIKNSWRWFSFASDNMKGQPNGTASPGDWSLQHYKDIITIFWLWLGPRHKTFKNIDSDISKMILWQKIPRYIGGGFFWCFFFCWPKIVGKNVTFWLN